VRIAYVVGARPNFVKVAPLYHALRERLPEAGHIVIHTGQHYDAAMSDVFIRELGLPTPHHALGVHSGRHGVQTGRIMEAIEPVLEMSRPDLVIVPGDVNSTLAATLVAVKLRLPLVHLEAGLRSFDRTMPEEVNRIVADQFSDHLLIHSEEAIENLRAEGIPDERMHVVGNTMIDTLVAFEDRFRAVRMAERFGLDAGSYLLVTLHRPALVDSPLLDDVIAHLGEIAGDLPVMFPVHPRTRKMLDRAAVQAPAGVLFCEPLGYLEFLSLQADARAVLTDSGGVQEETTYLGVPCYTLRDSTERPVTITHGTNHLLGLEPARILEIPGLLQGRPPVSGPPPLWDGHASERAAEVLAGVGVA
jgi:UDP-N-acetylglucosamine 2-epimerase (non-hydrolysing)